MTNQQSPNSLLFITLDSCRYDTFRAAKAPNLKAVGQLYQAMSPGYFTYASHAAMFVGFTPGVSRMMVPYINPKYGKLFRLVGSAASSGKGGDYFTLEGRNIIEGFKRLGYLTVGTGAVRWFDPETQAGRTLSQDFDTFFYPGDTYSLDRQIQWLWQQLQDGSRPVFAFLNIGETHTPYYYPGAPWKAEDNPCIPFAKENRRRECQRRQRACLEYVDLLLQPILESFGAATIFICGDHGDCWGENGLWEHGFYHPKVMEVPLIIKLPTSGSIHSPETDN